MNLMERSIFDVQAEFCRAMGNAIRLQILHILRERSMNVSEIMLKTNQSQSTISQHLAVLRSVGVVMGDRQGNEIFYRLTNERIGDVCDLVRAVLIEQTKRQTDTLADL